MPVCSHNCVEFMFRNWETSLEEEIILGFGLPLDNIAVKGSNRRKCDMTVDLLSNFNKTAVTSGSFASRRRLSYEQNSCPSKLPISFIAVTCKAHSSWSSFLDKDATQHVSRQSLYLLSSLRLSTFLHRAFISIKSFSAWILCSFLPVWLVGYQ